MHLDGSEFLVTPGELVALTIRLGLEERQLSVIPTTLPTDDEEAAVDGGLAALSSEASDHLGELLATLAAPARIVALGYTMADEAISRQIITWPDRAADDVVFLLRQGGPWRLGSRPREEISVLVGGVLAADDGVRADPLAVGLDASSVVALLAIVDWLRAARLFAELEHQDPTTMFTAEGVHARLAGSQVEDFRWPLAFFEKFCPGQLPALTVDDVRQALVELRDADIIDAVDEQTGSMFTLTATGDVIADAFFHEVSKVALEITECRPDGNLGHETLLFVRGVFNIFLFDIDGATGSVAAISAEQLDRFMTSLLEPPDEDRVAWSRQPLELSPAAPDLSTGEATCASCGATISESVQFCTACGEPRDAREIPPPLLRCPSCGSEVPEGNRFCSRCGASLPVSF